MANRHSRTIRLNSPTARHQRKSQQWPEDFTAKLFCKVEFWIERLPKLIGTANVIPNSGVTPTL